MYEFNYHRPASLAEAADLFKACDDARYLSGGQTLLPTMKQRLAQPSDLVDIGAIAELSGIARRGDALVIGAGTRHADVAGSAEARPALQVRSPGFGSRLHAGAAHRTIPILCWTPDRPCR